jgi:hypothetical protein
MSPTSTLPLAAYCPDRTTVHTEPAGGRAAFSLFAFLFVFQELRHERHPLRHNARNHFDPIRHLQRKLRRGSNRLRHRLGAAAGRHL